MRICPSLPISRLAQPLGPSMLRQRDCHSRSAGSPDMANTSSVQPNLADEPNAAEVARLARSLQADFLDGLVSSKAYDHRCRVLRQQRARLSSSRGSAAGSSTAGLPSSSACPPRREERSHASHSGSAHFTIFRSAAEECASASRSLDRWENEGGHTVARAGRVVLTPDGPAPYKVVLAQEDGSLTEQGCASMRAGEEMIRQHMPRPIARDTSRDHAAGEA